MSKGKRDQFAFDGREALRPEPTAVSIDWAFLTAYSFKSVFLAVSGGFLFCSLTLRTTIRVIAIKIIISSRNVISLLLGGGSFLVVCSAIVTYFSSMHSKTLSQFSIVYF